MCHSTPFLGSKQENTTNADIYPVSMSRLRLTSKFYITVCTLTGRVFALDDIHDDTTIDEMKNRIHRVTGIPQDQQRLIYRGKQLEDGMSDFGTH